MDTTSLGSTRTMSPRSKANCTTLAAMAPENTTIWASCEDLRTRIVVERSAKMRLASKGCFVSFSFTSSIAPMRPCNLRGHDRTPSGMRPRHRSLVHRQPRGALVNDKPGPSLVGSFYSVRASKLLSETTEAPLELRG